MYKAVYQPITLALLIHEENALAGGKLFKELMTQKMKEYCLRYSFGSSPTTRYILS